MDKRLLYDLARAGVIEPADVDTAGRRRRTPCRLPRPRRRPRRTAFSLTGDKWFCKTNDCHRDYGCGLPGLFVVLADRYAGPAVRDRDDNGIPRFKPALAWVRANSNKLRGVFKDRAEATVRNGAGKNTEPTVSPYDWTRKQVVESLDAPSAYFLHERGFSPEALRAHLVGTPTGAREALFSRWPGWSLSRRRTSTGRPVHRVRGPAALREGGPGAVATFQRSAGRPAAVQLLGAVQANLRGCRRLIVCEGVGDAMRCCEAGYRRRWPCSGTTSWTARSGGSTDSA